MFRLRRSKELRRGGAEQLVFGGGGPGRGRPEDFGNGAGEGRRSDLGFVALPPRFWSWYGVPGGAMQCSKLALGGLVRLGILRYQEMGYRITSLTGMVHRFCNVGRRCRRHLIKEHRG